MMSRPRFGGLRWVGTALVGALAIALMQAAPAAADTAPVPPVTTSTVSADALPTVQINGVIWAQVVVGTRVYATGSFTQARPAGAAAGTSQTARSNILAYDLTTGNLITSWAPTLNAQGLAIAASPDGSRIYVGGDFTSVTGVARSRLVALDATTGAVITSFASGPSGTVRAVAVTSDTVYAGGDFTVAGGQARSRLAAWATANGALRTWAPAAEQGVMALVAPAGSGEVIAGGHFTTLNGESQIGMGALDATTGQTKPWAINQTIHDYGPDAAIYSLSTDGNKVYGTGYGYLVNHNPDTNANLENSFAANVNGGALVWVNGCLGDTYSSFPTSGVLYTVGHAHNCSPIGGHPQTNPTWTFQRALATTTNAGNGLVNQGGALNGLPAPELLHWLPTLSAGSYTGQAQGGWSVSGNSQYVVVGGEFPSVNGTAQQGLVRFAVRSIAPNKQGFQLFTNLTPNVTSLAPGVVRVAWTAGWDRDNRQLTYEVLRGSTVANSVVLATKKQDSAWWKLPPMAFTDRSAPGGTTQTYRIRASDALGNSLVGTATSFAVPTGTAQPSPYTDAVQGDAPTNDWRLGEPSGTTGYDWISGDDLTLDSSAVRGESGALNNETSNAATTFTGSATVPGTTASVQPGPQTFSTEAWFKTTSTSGGKIIGFGDSSTATSSSYDRQTYMTNSGRLVFGVYPNQVRAVESPGSYNDGNWHHVVATLGADGQQLYVDGKKVAGRSDTTSAQAYSGYWRIGGDNLGGWPDSPSNQKFTGTIDEVAVYPAALSLQQVRAHYIASGRTLIVPQRPSDAYGAAVWDDQPDLYLRVDEASGSSAVNTMTAEAGATYSSGVTLGATGSPAAPAGKSITFSGNGETVVAVGPSSNPQVYSEEVWFKTSSQTGGRIIGFGNAASGNSGSYDRIINLLDNGTLRYGIYTGNVVTIDSPPGYNDGKWHHVVATQGPAGEKLYVDGSLQASSPVTGAQAYDGYWRLGADNTWGGNSGSFNGSLDEAAIYSTVLSASTIAAHYQFGAPANQAPTAAFTSIHTDLAATFDASTSNDPDGTISSYAWDFGDGTTGTGVSPSHAYAAADTYSVKLTVTDNGGRTDTATHNVTVTPPPNQDPLAAFTSTATNLAASFDGTGSSDPDGTISSYAWDFGDSSNGTGATPNHTYAGAGTYHVTLTVTDNRGGTGSITQDLTVTAPAVNEAPHALFTPTCTNLTCSFDSSASNDTDGSIASYAWDFGDTHNSSAGNPTHAYTTAGTYTVTLTVTDNKGATGTASGTVTATDPPNQAPMAAFTSTSTNLSVAFNAGASSDPDGTVASYAWDFGDSSNSTGSTPTHVYAGAGTYQVTLTVTDNKGATGSTIQPVTVTAPAVNDPPHAAFTSSATNLTAAFNASTSTDSDGTVASYAWAFGDGETGTGVTPSHTYAVAGTYPITLTVTDDKGATGTASGSVTVATAALATDAFGRTVTNGLGSADTGGAWTIAGTAGNFAVTGSAATLRMSSASAGPSAFLNSVSSSATDLRVSVGADKLANGNGTTLWSVGRHTSGGDYRGRVRLLSNGSVGVAISKYISGTETLIGTELTLPGVTYTPGSALLVRLQVQGTGTTTVRIKVWKAGTTEPTDWQRTGTDTTAALQGAGGVGIGVYLSGSSTSAPVVATFDDLSVRPL